MLGAIALVEPLGASIMTTTATKTSKPLDQGVFRDVIGNFTSGVTVITTKRGDERFGVTASAVSSLSMDPPMLLVCLNRQLATADAITESGVFAVNILDEDQGQLATQFATRHPDKFRGVSVADGALGIPVLGDALAHLECSVTERINVATHAVFMAEVQDARTKSGKPLVYFRSKFGRFYIR
jgi:flavin reductase (DIM6/NTAB) family NADH-FMN oxidoreductase RutF